MPLPRIALSLIITSDLLGQQLKSFNVLLAHRLTDSHTGLVRCGVIFESQVFRYPFWRLLCKPRQPVISITLVQYNYTGLRCPG